MITIRISYLLILLLLPLRFFAQDLPYKATVKSDNDVVLLGDGYRALIIIPGEKNFKVLDSKTSTGNLDISNDSIFLTISNWEAGLHRFEGYIRLKTASGVTKQYDFHSAFYSQEPIFFCGSTTLIKGQKNTVYVNQYPKLFAKYVVKVDNGEVKPSSSDPYTYFITPSRKGKLTLFIYYPGGDKLLLKYNFNVF